MLTDYLNLSFMPITVMHVPFCILILNMWSGVETVLTYTEFALKKLWKKQKIPIHDLLTLYLNQ